MPITATESSSRESRDRMKASLGGYRSIVLVRLGDRAFFVYGFAKSTQDNIDESDERDFKELAKTVLAASNTELENLVSDGKYVEVTCNDQS